MQFKTGVAIVAMLLLVKLAAHAQEANGAAVFSESCASCHGDNAAAARAPKLDALRLQAAESVLQVLTTGVMRTQASRLNPSEVRAVAEFVTGKRVTTEIVDPQIGRCATQTPMSDIERTPHWNGWGVDTSNARFQTAAQAGLSATDVPKLKLKWAFGLPDQENMYVPLSDIQVPAFGLE